MKDTNTKNLIICTCICNTGQLTELSLKHTLTLVHEWNKQLLLIVKHCLLWWFLSIKKIPFPELILFVTDSISVFNLIISVNLLVQNIVRAAGIPRHHAAKNSGLEKFRGLSQVLFMFPDHYSVSTLRTYSSTSAKKPQCTMQPNLWLFITAASDIKPAS